MITTTTPAVSPLAKILGRQPAKPSVDVPESRACLGGSSSNSGPTPQASGDGGPRAGAAVVVVDGIVVAPAIVPPGLTRCSKCSGRIRWIDAYRSLRCSWCEPPLAVSQVREVWGEVGEEIPTPDPDDLWGEPTSAEDARRGWVRLDVPKDVTGGLGAVVGVGGKWDGLWWCEVVEGREVQHRLGAVSEFLYDRPK